MTILHTASSVPTASPARDAAPEPLITTQLPAEFSTTTPAGEVIRHILLGRPGAIHQTIHLLHNLRYVEVSR